MSPLRQALADYLRIRRALGYKLERAEKLLGQYLEYLEQLGFDTVTIEHAVAWATLPPAGDTAYWWAFRLSAARGFARYLYGSTSGTRCRWRTCCPSGCTGRSRTCTRRRRSSR